MGDGAGRGSASGSIAERPTDLPAQDQRAGAPPDGERARGLAYVMAVYVAWGLMPAYWKLGAGIPAATVIAHRAIWAFAIMALAFFSGGGKRRAAGIRLNRAAIALCAASSAALFVQWAAYLAAVEAGRLVDLSLGYFIYPVAVALLGVPFLKERLGPDRIVALALAGVGVAIKIWLGGGVPIIALALAFSFAAYSLLKKKIKLDSASATFFELAYMAPFALAYAAYVEASGSGAFVGRGAWPPLFLIGGGVATAVTLLLFAAGARRMPIATVGLLQYLSPTMVLLLGVLAYGEPFDPGQAAAFGFVWLGLAVDAIPAIRSGLRSRAAKAAGG